MAIDLLSEEVVRLGHASRFYPVGRGGRPTAPSTPWRHAMQGVRTPDGRVVRLEAVRTGSSWTTSRQAVERFFAALTTACLPPVESEFVVALPGGSPVSSVGG